MHIRAITFDVGGTIIEPWPSVGHVYAEVAGRFGVNGISPDWLTQNFIRVWKAQTQFDYRRASWFDLVRETFGGRAVSLPPEFYPAVYDRFAEADAWKVFDDVLPALKGLRERGLKLGIVSNWDDRLRGLLDRLGLAEFFACQIISCEVGATKPDRRLFEHAAAELGIVPGELLHVGDSNALDVAGAQNAGARGLQVERRLPLTASWQIAALTELLERISPSKPVTN